jgi:hypothetical protein
MRQEVQGLQQSPISRMRLYALKEGRPEISNHEGVEFRASTIQPLN